MPQQKRMPDNLGLLLDPVLLQPPVGLENIIIAPRKGADQWQIPPAMVLRLPDVGHLVNEVALEIERSGGEIIAVIGRLRVEVQVPPWRHGDGAWLEGKPAFTPDGHLGAVDRLAEHRMHQRNFTRRQWPFAACRAGRRGSGFDDQ